MVFDFERNKIRQQEIEVQALVALTKYGSQPQKFKALNHLEKIAYPEDLAEKLNQMRFPETNNEQEKLEYQ